MKIELTKSYLAFFLLVVITIPKCSGQIILTNKYSLLTWEYKREGSGVLPGLNAFVLVKYSYSDSGYTRHEIFRTQSYAPHYSDYETEVFNDEFLINSRGDIFDLKNNKVIHDHIGFDDYLIKSGDSVIYRNSDYKPASSFDYDTARHNSIKSKYYFFSLKTREIIPLNNKKSDGLWKYEGLLSPDKKMTAYFIPDQRKQSGDILNKDTSLILSCGWARIFPTDGAVFVKSSDKDSLKIISHVVFDFALRSPNYIPIIWLNNNEIITQKKNGSLIKVMVTPNTSKEYTVLNNAIQCIFPGRLEKVNKKEIFYYCKTANGEIFRVNDTTGSLELISIVPVSESYSVKPRSGNPRNEYANEYYYNSSKILDDTTATLHYSITPDELIAIQCKELIPSRNQYDNWNYIKIFDPSKKEWTIIKVEYLKELIGWVREE